MKRGRPSSSTSVSSSERLSMTDTRVDESIAAERLQARELLLVRFGELLGEQSAEARFGILGDLPITFAIEIPIAQLRGHSKDRPLLQLPIEILLYAPGIEASEQR